MINKKLCVRKLGRNFSGNDPVQQKNRFLALGAVALLTGTIATAISSCSDHATLGIPINAGGKAGSGAVGGSGGQTATGGSGGEGAHAGQGGIAGAGGSAGFAGEGGTQTGGSGGSAGAGGFAGSGGEGAHAGEGGAGGFGGEGGSAGTGGLGGQGGVAGSGGEAGFGGEAGAGGSSGFGGEGGTQTGGAGGEGGLGGQGGFAGAGGEAGAGGQTGHCPTAFDETISSEYIYLNTPTSVGGYDFIYKGESGTGSIIDIECSSNNAVVGTYDCAIYSITTITAPDKSIDIEVHAKSGTRTRVSIAVY